MVADSPDAYENAPGYDFLKRVPAAWDETRFLGGDIDSHVIVARRKGRDWYVGVMGNEKPREVSVPLAFLGEGRFKARIWADGATSTAVEVFEQAVGATDALRLKLAASGGAAIHISP
jgi:alpha-glucosidase